MRAANWRSSIDVAMLAALVASVIPRIFFIQGVRIHSLAALTIEAAKAVRRNRAPSASEGSGSESGAPDRLVRRALKNGINSLKLTTDILANRASVLGVRIVSGWGLLGR